MYYAIVDLEMKNFKHFQYFQTYISAIGNAEELNNLVSVISLKCFIFITCYYVLMGVILEE